MTPAELPPALVPDWYPDHVVRRYEPPELNHLLAYAHAVWRAVDIRSVPEDRWTDEQRRFHRLTKPAARWRTGAVPVVVTVRPVAITSDDPAVRRHDLHLSSPGVQPEWWVYRDEHYPVCGTCGEPTPCRERLGMRVAEQAMAQMARYEQPGMCPSCREVVTTRQKSWTCPDNLEIPGGPPVTYHVGRLGCRWAATEYEKRWVALDPKTRRPRWSCPGHVTTHGDGTYECSTNGECPGPLAGHQSYARCGCLSCRPTVPSNCRPAADATRRS